MPSNPRDPDSVRFRLREDFDGELVIFLNGILTRPGDQFAWTDRAERWFLEGTRHEVDSAEYFGTPIGGRILGNRSVYHDALALIGGYLGAAAVAKKPIRVHLVAHSNGCEIARRLIVESGIRFRSAHFFAPAVEADFEKNGLNEALAKRKVDRVQVFASRGDWVLRFVAPLSLGLYGRMGYTGPQNVRASVAGRVDVTLLDKVGHSEWFQDGEMMDRSMWAVENEIDDLPF